jgi:hypothetical protein
LKLLVVHEARFLLIGGYAVNAFGYIRNTIDLDIWIAGDELNRKRMLQAVRDFAFPLAAANLLVEPDAMLRMGVPPLRIEVMRSISGVDFDDCWTRRVLIDDEDLQIPLISLTDLRKSKRSSGRPKDLLDVEELS